MREHARTLTPTLSLGEGAISPLVVRDAEFTDEVRARTWDEYFDFLPFARQYLREALIE